MPLVDSGERDAHATDLQAVRRLHRALFSVQRRFGISIERQPELLGEILRHPQFRIAVVNPGTNPLGLSIG